MGLYEIEIILWEDGVRQNYDVYKYLEPILNERYIEGIRNMMKQCMQTQGIAIVSELGILKNR